MRAADVSRAARGGGEGRQAAPRYSPPKTAKARTRRKLGLALRSTASWAMRSESTPLVDAVPIAVASGCVSAMLRSVRRKSTH